MKAWSCSVLFGKGLSYANLSSTVCFLCCPLGEEQSQRLRASQSNILKYIEILVLEVGTWRRATPLLKLDHRRISGQSTRFARLLYTVFFSFFPSHYIDAYCLCGMIWNVNELDMA